MIYTVFISSFIYKFIILNLFSILCPHTLITAWWRHCCTFCPQRNSPLFRTGNTFLNLHKNDKNDMSCTTVVHLFLLRQGLEAVKWDFVHTTAVNQSLFYLGHMPCGPSFSICLYVIWIVVLVPMFSVFSAPHLPPPSPTYIFRNLYIKTCYIW